MSSNEASQASEPLQVHWLSGQQAFTPLWEAMHDYTAQRTEDSPDQLWLLEHEPVYTLGLAGRPEHVLYPRAIPLVHTDRGGQVTYHGPGQLVAYCLLDLRRYGLYVKSYVALLERVILDTLAALGADYACLQPGAPGVYVPLGYPDSKAGPAHTGQTPEQQAKIAALGVKISKGCSYHGVAINVDMDLSPFEGINPCGYVGLRTTDLAHCGIHTTVSRVGHLFTSHLQHTLSHRLSVTTLD